MRNQVSPIVRSLFILLFFGTALFGQVDFSDNFESGSLDQWTVGGRQEGVNTAEVVSLEGSQVAHIRHEDYTEITLGKNFGYSTDLQFAFDMQVAVTSDASNTSTFWAAAGVFFRFYDADTNSLGWVSYEKYTSQLNPDGHNTDSTLVNEIVSEVMDHYDLSIDDILGQVTLAEMPSLVKLEYRAYTTGWPYNMSGDVWIDNVVIEHISENEETSPLERIVFSSNQAGNYDIWMMNPDGTEKNQLTNTPEDETGPVISHEGFEIAFVRYGDDEYFIVQYSLADSIENIIYSSPLPIYSPISYFPNDSLILFSQDLLYGQAGENGEVLSVNIYDGAVTNITNTSAYHNEGGGDVGNQTIVYYKDTNGWACGYCVELFVMDHDGSNDTQVTDSYGHDIEARILGDSLIVYRHSQGSGTETINLIKTDGTGHVELTSGYYPSWAPDGNLITYVQNDAIMVCDKDGANITQLTNDDYIYRTPYWGLIHYREQSTLQIGMITAMSDLTTLIPVYYQGSSFRAAELNFSGYTEGLEFIGIDTVGTMIGGLDWTWAENEVEGVLQTAFAGSDEITGDGVFCYLEFMVTGDACSTVPVNCDYALFNDVEVTDITNGSVTIEPTPDYGDVDENGLFQALDASDILMYLVDSLDLACQAWTNADVDLSDTVDAMDASYILQFVVDSIDSLPVPLGVPDFLASGSLGLV